MAAAAQPELGQPQQPAPPLGPLTGHAKKAYRGSRAGRREQSRRAGAAGLRSAQLWQPFAAQAGPQPAGAASGATLGGLTGALAQGQAAAGSAAGSGQPMSARAACSSSSAGAAQHSSSSSAATACGSSSSAAGGAAAAAARAGSRADMAGSSMAGMDIDAPAAAAAQPPPCTAEQYAAWLHEVHSSLRAWWCRVAAWSEISEGVLFEELARWAFIAAQLMERCGLDLWPFDLNWGPPMGS